MRTARCAALAFVVFLWSSVVAANPSTRLVYVRGVGAESCPDEAAFRARVRERLGYDPVVNWAKRTIISEVRRSGARFSARFQVIDGHGLLQGERQIATGGDCEDVANALALAVSLVVDDLGEEPPPPEEPMFVEAAPPAPEPPLPKPPARQTELPLPLAPRPARPAWELEVALGPSGSIGLPPGPVLGAFVQGDLRRASLRLGVELEVTTRASAPVGATASSTSVGLGSAAATACLQPSFWFTCGVVRGSWLRFASHDVQQPATAAEGIASAGARFGVQVAVSSRWFVRAQGDVELTPWRYALRVDESTTFTTRPWLARASVLLGARFR